MTIKNYFIVCLILGLFNVPNIYGQTKFDVPQNVVLKTKSDFAKYEPAIINAAKWLEETDLNKDTEKRREVNAFVITWLAGTSTVVVGIDENLTKIYGTNMELLGVYLANYARNFLENKEHATKFTATKAGLISMMKVYKKGIDISPNQEMDHLIQLSGKNELDDYIKANFK